ncbi:MAG: hypothetical protein ACRYE7_01525 [Janthinobacterium lividum]
MEKLTVWRFRFVLFVRIFAFKPISKLDSTIRTLDSILMAHEIKTGFSHLNRRDERQWPSVESLQAISINTHITRVLVTTTHGSGEIVEVKNRQAVSLSGTRSAIVITAETVHYD